MEYGRDRFNDHLSSVAILLISFYDEVIPCNWIISPLTLSSTIPLYMVKADRIVGFILTSLKLIYQRAIIMDEEINLKLLIK